MFLSNNSRNSGKKRRAPDNLTSDKEKRQLVDYLSQLSLNVGESGQATEYYERGSNKIPASKLKPLDSDYMDTSGPNTIFIPSIDEFLSEDIDEVDRNNIYLNSDLPLSVLANQPVIKLHFYQRPSLALILYEPISLTIWRPFFAWQSNNESKLTIGDEIEIDNETETPLDEDMVDIDINEPQYEELMNID